MLTILGKFGFVKKCKKKLVYKMQFGNYMKYNIFTDKNMGNL